MISSFIRHRLAGFLGGLLVLAMLAAPSAHAETAAEIVEKANTYFNNLTTARARFAQVDHQGGVVQGTMTIARPGQLKFDYDPPVEVMIVAGAGWVHFLDYEVGNTTSLPVGQTPLGLLVQDHLNLEKDARILTAMRVGDVYQIALQAKDDEEEGVLTLEFSADPFVLQGWRVTDALDQQTRVVLRSLRVNIKLPFDAFLYEDPEAESEQTGN